MKARLTVLLLVTVAALLSCKSPTETASDTDRELLAADVRDALAVAATIPEAQPYVAVVEPILVAFVEDDSGFDWPAAFAAVHAAEPAFRDALIDAGWDEMRAQAAISVANLLLRRIEAQVAPQPPPQTSASIDVRRLAATVQNPLTFSSPRVVETIHRGGAWHFLNGERRDNFGDGFLGIVLIGDQRWYVAWMRMGGPGVGGCFWFKKYDKNPYQGWSQGHPPGWNGVAVKAFPGGTQWANLDTYCFAQNPLTQAMTQVFAAKPFGAGDRYTLTRATSTTVDPRAEAYDWGGSSLTEPNTQECSLVIDPWVPCAYLFYVEKTTEAPDRYGIRFRSRVWRQRVDLRRFDSKFAFVGEPKMVFSPDQGEDGAWGSAFTVLQPGIAILPNRVYIMAALGKVPIAHPNGQTAVGQMNRTTAVGIWLSFDQGATWEEHPKNPVFSREFLGLFEQHGNQINSPHFFVDPWLMRLYFASWINPVGECNKLGTRLVLCEADLR